MAGLTLDQLAALAEIIGACTIVTGLIFGAYQIRAHRIQQRSAVATSLAKTLYNPDFAKAVPEFEEAAVIVSASIETMGLLVYKKIAPFDLVMDLAGGMAASMFRKLEKSIIAQRIDQNQPSWAE